MSTEMQTETGRPDVVHETAPHRTSPMARALEILRHPLLLLVVGALLSSYLIPTWTRQSQERRAELEVKVALVTSIDEAVTEMTMAIQMVAVGSAAYSLEDYSSAYRQWEVELQLIRSRLLAYYPESGLARDWETLSSDITAFYAESGTQEPEEWRAYVQTWGERRDALFARKDALNQEILSTPIRVFR